jgi:hypothetical protein
VTVVVGNLPAGSVPEVMFVATVVSVVALAANPVTVLAAWLPVWLARWMA